MAAFVKHLCGKGEQQGLRSCLSSELLHHYNKLVPWELPLLSLLPCSSKCCTTFPLTLACRKIR